MAFEKQATFIRGGPICGIGPGLGPPGIQQPTQWDIPSSSPTETGFSESQRQRNLKSSLTLFGLFIIFVGIVIELVVLGFFLFLWIGHGSSSDGRHGSPFWRTIMLRGWFEQTITILCVVLQVLVAAQSTICTSLVAALLLEGFKVPFKDVAHFSIMRAVNGGPLSVVTHLFAWTRYSFRSWPSFLIMILLLETLVVQFSSTILLVDEGTGSVLSWQTHPQVPVVETQSSLIAYAEYWHTPFTDGYPSFAESRIGDQRSDEGLDDTGTIQRAILPFNGDDRKRLRQYQGPMAVQTSRTTCVRPTFINATFLGDNGMMTKGEQWRPWISANLTIPPELYDNGIITGSPCKDSNSSCSSFPIGCELPGWGSSSGLETTGPSMNGPQVSTAICMINGTNQVDNGNVYKPETVIMSLVLNATGYTRDIRHYIGEGLPEPTSTDEWTSYQLGNSSFDVTMCLTTLNVTIQHAYAESSVDLKEPSMSLNTKTAQWQYGDVLAQMGVTNASNEDRGIMTLVNSTQYTKTELQDIYNNSAYFSADVDINYYVNDFTYLLVAGLTNLPAFQGSETEKYPTNYTIATCLDCTILLNALLPNEYYKVLFNGIVNTTGHAAAAIDSTLTWIVQNQYYKALPSFDFGDGATATFSKQASVPVRFAGFATIVALMLIHIASVLAIVALFWRRARFSIVGNAWHTIAQLLSPETQDMLHGATELTDDEFMQQLKTRGLGRVDSGLERWESHGTNRVTVARKPSVAQGLGATVEEDMGGDHPELRW
ncbi:Uu.00g117040.m01.CDS01 [Anthostomella pinea]|uniref:Uu.00g117040.m01.CDS01 n=1 Tax=Anthostomella pinea TaxID=933095 RepID=A0AAI8VG63_9PEZI|nr:Uu.00g117040.m01.CDS01 [Anthostomella pinea]